MSGDLARAYEFVLRADMAGTRVEPWRFGTAVFMPEANRRIDSNYLIIDPVPHDIAMADLIAEANAVQGGAGLAHRCLFFRDGPQAAPLRDSFKKEGWLAFQGIVMAHREASQKDVNASLVRRTDSTTIRAHRKAQLLEYPWCDEEIANQLLEVRRFIPVPTEYFAIFDGDQPAAWAELYVEDGVAQVEAVATRHEYRNRGYASALVMHSVQRAHEQDAEFVFLVADATDWPKDLYAKLGFRELGRYAKFIRE